MFNKTVVSITKSHGQACYQGVRWVKIWVRRRLREVKYHFRVVRVFGK